MPCLGIDIGGSSVKVVLIDLPKGHDCAHAQSDPYARPTLDQLAQAVTAAIGRCMTSAEHSSKPIGAIGSIGLCLPGLYDDQQGCITKATNLPALEGVNLDAFLRSTLEGAGLLGSSSESSHTRHTRHARHAPGRGFCITTDTYAAALDIVHTQQLTGRLLCLSLGTGVGAAVLDIAADSGALPTPVLVSGNTPGHIGQLDVSLDDAAPTDDGGARGTLESFISLATLRRSGAVRDIEILMEQGACCAHKEQPALPQSLEEPMRALARALRICHALYRPDHIYLAGGVGIALAPWIDLLKKRVNDGLTPLAKDTWTLGVATDALCAARGTARYAFAPVCLES